MRSLELVGTGGFAITLFFVALVCTRSIMTGCQPYAQVLISGCMAWAVRWHMHCMILLGCAPRLLTVVHMQGSCQCWDCGWALSIYRLPNAMRIRERCALCAGQECTARELCCLW